MIKKEPTEKNGRERNSQGEFTDEETSQKSEVWEDFPEEYQ